MIKYKEKFTYIILAIVFVLFCFSAITIFNKNFQWHDQQRILQILLLFSLTLSTFFIKKQLFTRTTLIILYCIFIIGFISSITAEFPEWALKEWAHNLGLILIIGFLGHSAKQIKIRLLIILSMVTTGFILAFQFLIFYISAFLSGIQILDADLLISGFSNPRFFGQFQVILIPVLAWLVLDFRQEYQYKKFILIITVLSIHWCIALMLGGRGLWLSLAISNMSLYFISPLFWRFFRVQIITGLLGFILFIFLFHLIPHWLDLPTTLHENLRTTLSGREKIWQWALDMAIANPLLGKGPMHFSSIQNEIAAHPHQVILQWLSEWGFIATFFILVLIGKGIIYAIKYIRTRDPDNYDVALWLAIIGSLALAQVDGVFIMPYTETWLAIVTGLALAQWSTQEKKPPFQQCSMIFLSLPTLLILGNILFNEIPSLAEDSKSHREAYNSGYTPRFWQQGWIPMRSK